MATSVLHIKTEVECKVFLFDEEKGIATTDKYFNLEVRKGEQDLLFVSTSNEDLQCSMLFQVEESDHDYRIVLENSKFTNDKTKMSDVLLKQVTTGVSKDEIAEGIEDDFGVVYSQDGTQLLKSKDCYITSYQVKEGCKVIRSNAFLYHRELLNVTLPDSLLYIGNCAFSGCDALSNITLPACLTYIGDGAFFGCKLSEIILPNSLNHIGCGAFKSTQISIVINNSPFFSFSNDCLIDLQEKTLIAFLSDKESVDVPVGITHIGNNVFDDCRNLTSVTLPTGITHIGDCAFSCCVNLSNINLPDSITHIGNSAFSSCQNLSNISLPNSLTYIGDDAFNDCKKFKNIVLPANLTHIGCCAFNNIQIESIICKTSSFKFENRFLIDLQNKRLISCHSERSWIETPEGITHICKGAFVFLKNLSTLVLSNGITHIGESAFVGCDNLKIIRFPETLTHIGKSAFCGCEGLTNINLPNGLTNIADKAFLGCYYLSSITLPNSLTIIGEDAFSLCKCLSSITLPDKLTQISNGVFVGCENLTSISLPNTLTYIGDSAFYGCRGLTEIKLPDNLTHIGEKAFYDCVRLTHIVFPESITQIGELAFNNCIKLSSIDVPSDMREYYEAILPPDLHDKIKEEFRFVNKIVQEFNPYYLFFDTETTGVPQDYNAPASNTGNWPRLVQLGWILTDETGVIISSGNEIVKPEGFVIPSDASRVHGITTENALRDGKPLRQVILSFLKDSDCAKCFVGHNISFDQRVVGAELYRLGIADTISTAKSLDTMKAATDYCKIPGTYGYKWPKLIELHRKLFGCDFEDAHDAMADITATKKCFFEMKRRGLI